MVLSLEFGIKAFLNEQLCSGLEVQLRIRWFVVSPMVPCCMTTWKPGFPMKLHFAITRISEVACWKVAQRPQITVRLGLPNTKRCN